MAVIDIGTLDTEVLGSSEAASRKWSYRRALATWLGLSAVVWIGFATAVLAVL